MLIQRYLFPPNKLWKIPILQRVIHTVMGFGTRWKFHVTDNVGFILYYDDRVPITDDLIRRTLILGETAYELIIATTKEAAMDIVRKKLAEGLATGGENPRSKAQIIVEEDIQEIPLCPRLKMATKGLYKGEWMCHFLDKHGNQEDECLGGCMFSHYDSPECCPIEYSTKEKKWLMKETKPIGC